MIPCLDENRRAARPSHRLLCDQVFVRMASCCEAEKRPCARCDNLPHRVAAMRRIRSSVATGKAFAQYCRRLKRLPTGAAVITLAAFRRACVLHSRDGEAQNNQTDNHNMGRHPGDADDGACAVNIARAVRIRAGSFRRRVLDGDLQRFRQESFGRRCVRFPRFFRTEILVGVLSVLPDARRRDVAAA